MSASHSPAERSLPDAARQTLTEHATPVLEALIDLHRRTGDYGQALAQARVLQRRDPMSAKAHRDVGELLLLAGRSNDATQPLQRAMALAAEAEDPASVTAAEAALAELHYQEGRYAEAQALATRVVDSSGAESGTLIHAHNTLAKIALARVPKGAVALFEKNYQRALAEGLRAEQAQALTNLGIAYLHEQDLTNAEQALTAARRIADRVGDLRERAIATENLAVLAHLRRAWGEARDRYHEAVSLLRQLGNRPMLARVAANLGELYLSLGDATRAQALAGFASQVGGSGLPDVVLAETLMLQGRIARSERRWDEARASFEAARERYSQPENASHDMATLELAGLELEAGNTNGAAVLASGLRPGSSPKWNAQIALLESDRLRAEGRPSIASSENALSLTQRSGDASLQLRALVGHAELLREIAACDAAQPFHREARELEARLTATVPSDAMTLWRRRSIHQRLESLGKGLECDRAERGIEHVVPSTNKGLDPSRTGLLHTRSRYPRLLGSSPSIVGLRQIVDRVAPTNASALIVGESGTGKELVAEALHRHSDRAAGPFLKVHCGALVDALLLSELFGHERGAFTGAYARKKGRFELANHGTLFLDEIGDISPRTQTALLRAVEDRCFIRVGGTKTIPTDVRIVAATHRDLEAMVRDGTFRKDLYYRLRGVLIETPPLRDRIGDLPLLVADVLQRIATERAEAPRSLSRVAIDHLAAHRWPGNVRELENVLRSATLLSDAALLGPDDLCFPDDPESAINEATVHQNPELPLEDALYKRIRAGDRSLLEMKKDLERECIVRALAETGGNITKAATLLGMKRPRLSQLVKHYRVQRPDGARG